MNKCPHCGADLEMHTSAAGDMLKPQGFTFCMYCTGLLRMSATGALYAMSVEEFAQLDSGMIEQLGRIQAELVRAKKRTPGGS